LKAGSYTTTVKGSKDDEPVYKLRLVGGEPSLKEPVQEVKAPKVPDEIDDAMTARIKEGSITSTVATSVDSGDKQIF